MALTVKGLPRVFKYNNNKLSDPNPDMSPSEVLKFYMGSYPELTSGSVSGPEILDDEQVYNFSTTIGTKG